MPETDYQPVPHDAAFRDALLAKPGVQKAFDALEEEYTTLHAMLDAVCGCEKRGSASVMPRHQQTTELAAEPRPWHRMPRRRASRTMSCTVRKNIS